MMEGEYYFCLLVISLGETSFRKIKKYNQELKRSRPKLQEVKSLGHEFLSKKAVALMASAKASCSSTPRL